MIRASAAQAGGPRFNPQWLPRIYLFQLAVTNVDGMKDLWCSSTVGLLDVNKVKDLWCSSTVWLLTTQI